MISIKFQEQAVCSFCDQPIEQQDLMFYTTCEDGGCCTNGALHLQCASQVATSVEEATRELADATHAALVKFQEGR